MERRKKVMSIIELNKLCKGLKQKSSLTLPPDPDSVTQAIKRINLQVEMWLQSLKPKHNIPIFCVEWLAMVH